MATLTRRRILIIVTCLAVVAGLIQVTTMVDLIIKENYLSTQLQKLCRWNTKPSVQIDHTTPIIPGQKNEEYRWIGFSQSNLELYHGDRSIFGDIAASFTDNYFFPPVNRIGLHDNFYSDTIDISYNIDTTELGKWMGISDLLLSAPQKLTSGAGSPADGLLAGTEDVELSGTISVPESSAAHSSYPISTSARLYLHNNQVKLISHDYYHGSALHFAHQFSKQLTPVVLKKFSTTLPPLELPFDLKPTYVLAERHSLVIGASLKGYPLHQLGTFCRA